MQDNSITPDHYISLLPGDRRDAMERLRRIILDNLPEGFEEGMGYGMIGYYVPHSVYPAGYHVDPKMPLPFISLASQKHTISLYHMGLYADKTLLDWFLAEYPKHSPVKPDIGKSCIRFKKPEHIPYRLIGELVRKMSARAWIALYEKSREK